MADEALRPAQEPLDIARLAELLELTQDAILVRDLRTSSVTYWNRGAERLYGWPRERARGRMTHTLLATRFPISHEAVDAALVTDGYWEGELVHTRQDGSQVTVSSRQAVQRDSSGQAIAILEINTDITQRKLAEEEHVRLASEQRARQLAERALDRISRLQQVTARLSEALTPAQVASVVVEHGVSALDARAGRIGVARLEQGSIEMLASSGYTTIRPMVPLDAPLPTTEVIRTRQPLFLTTFTDVTRRFPGMPEVAEPGIEGALASVPLVVEGRVIGAMTLAFEGDRAFAEDDRELLGALAKQCAQALERARLYELSLLIQEDLRRSRDQLAAILGGIAEGVTVQDVRGRLIYANDVAARLTGFASADELIDAAAELEKRISLFDEGGNPFPFDRLPGRRLLRGESHITEVEIEFRDLVSGEWRWSILDATPVCDEHGRLQLVVTIFRDSTERKRHTDGTEFLAAASTILGSTLDANVSLQQVAQLAVPRIADWCLIDVLDADSHPQRVAVAHADAEDAELARECREHSTGVGIPGGCVERVLRTGRGELVVEPPLAPGQLQLRSWIVVPLVTRRQVFGCITFATASSRRRFSQPDFALAEDLATRAAWAVDNARLYREAQEQADHQGVLNVALRETIEERDQAMADLQQALRTRDEFLASASHDLKNPLAAVKATAQLLARRLDRPGPVEVERMREGLHRLDAITTRAAGLVDELLDLARMQMGRPIELDRHQADLVRLAREVADEHQQATERHALRVESAQPELIGVWDSRRLGRVLSNLLDNAVKYSPDGGPIVVRVRSDGDWAVLDVTDAGIGVPHSDRDRIFERFQRASNVERRIGGTGIGLASARHILESHGGSIDVDSQEGNGATFTVRLPLAGVSPSERCVTTG